MKLLTGLLILLCTAAAAEPAADPRLLLLGDIPSAATTQKELLAEAASPETRARLAAWTALRQLGVQPEAEEAWGVRGAAVETGDGMVAVYEDGRLRWLDAEGNPGALESQSREMARLAESMMVAAATAMRSTRPMPHADASPLGKERVRLTVMTYAGYYVIDVHRPSLTEDHPVSVPLAAATDLLRLLPPR
ncbi:MAG TPA: hypothetical protein VFP80_18595 [Thermoanaerobaculia bacterium]|nr:hypothetical protein [Thermoanaerobaculia bacterium]